jgi:iron complex outermembrane receptor protein
LTDRLHATAGIRGTLDRKQTEVDQTTAGRLYLAPMLACTYGDYSGICGQIPELRASLNPSTIVEPTHKSWRNYSPTFKLAYDLTSDSVVYIGAASGFKAGGLNTSGGVVTPYNPEKVRSYTLGYKTTLLDNHLRINTELFYNDYTDKQFAFVTFDKNNNLLNAQGNVGKTHTQGVDFESNWITPIDGLNISLNVGYLEAHLDKFAVPNFSTGVVNDIAASTALGFSPRWTVSPRVSYTMGVRDTGDLTFNAEANYRARQYTNTPIYLNDPLSVRQQSPEYTVFNASIVFKTADNHWRYALEGRNLTDRREVNNTYLVGPFVNAGYTDPFTWAFSVGYTY